jgi:hypothetical protein
MFASLGLGFLLIIAGIVLFVVPGIGIFGIVLIIVGVLLLVGGFATRGRTSSPPS